MKNISINIYNTIPKIILETIKDINEISKKLKIPFIIIGAIVRDWLFEYYKIPTILKTNDLDLAIQVSNWIDYNKMVNHLLLLKKFQKTKIEHRLLYNGKLYIDIIPFGKISKQNVLLWQKDSGTFIDLTGIKDVYEHSIIAILNDIITVKIPTLAGLTVLKFISWNDAYPNREKDAKDIFYIMKNYEKTLEIENIYKEYPVIFKNFDYNVELVGIYLLGRDISRILSTKAFNKIKMIVKNEIDNTSEYKLVSQMLKNYEDDDLENIINNLKIFYNGLTRNK